MKTKIEGNSFKVWYTEDNYLKDKLIPIQYKELY